MEANAEIARYFPVSPRKFIALSVLTGGLYQLYWFYQNWVFVRARDDSSILPWARGLFGVLWYPALLQDFKKNLQDGPMIPGGVLAPAAIYLVLNVSWRLPDPFWLVSFFSFLPLLPAVRQINSINLESSGPYTRNSRWVFRHFALAFFVAPVLVIIVASSIGLIPSTQVTPGWMLWGPSRSFLERSAIVAPDERVLYFYSAGLFSFAEDGNILTDERIISYWTDEETGELFVESASFSEIRDTAVDQGNWLKNTVLTVVRRDGSEFTLVLSAEDGRDQLFLDQLEQRLQ